MAFFRIALWSLVLLAILPRGLSAAEPKEPDRRRNSAPPPAPRMSPLAEGFSPDRQKREIAADWLAQDGAEGSDGLRTDVVHRILDELPATAGDLREQFDALSMANAPNTDPRWASLYFAACERRRGLRLEPHRKLLERIVFTKHSLLGGSHYAYTEGQSDAQRERHFKPGSSLCLFEMDGLYGQVRTLLEDPGGVIRDPDVAPDGKHILVAWKKSLNDDDYHLYEVALDDGQVRQITSGLGFADYEGIYLPNGDLLFQSTRCVQTVDCWWTEVSNLFTCAADGRYLRQLGFDQVHTNFPTVMPDGRIIYTRWDYNDRGQIFPQGLFSMNPDGTGQTEVYGNNSWFPTSILHARAIPGTGKIVCIISGHHTRQAGDLGIVEPRRGRQENQGVQLIAPVRPTPAVQIDQYAKWSDQFQYPYPLDEQTFLVSFRQVEPAQGGRRGRHIREFAVYVVTVDGRRELLISDPAISCNQAMPLLRPAGTALLADRVDYRQDSGTVYLHDVYDGPGLDGVPRGSVCQLRVVALEFRAAGFGENRNRGPAGESQASTPISIEGAWDVKRVLGNAQVYADGSACFTVPSRTPLYFQALDQKGQMIQTMRSWATLQPGEAVSCVGCHEHKNTSPPVGGVTLAMRAGPQTLDTRYDPTQGFSFIREVQPILDKHCVRCHYLDERPSYGQSPAQSELAAGETVLPAFSLKSTQTLEPVSQRKWSDGYRALADRRVCDWVNPQSAPPMLPPNHTGAAQSRLIRLLEDGSHYGVKLSDEELDPFRVWIDLLIPYCGDYAEAMADEGLPGYNHFLDKRRRWHAEEKGNIADLLRDRSKRR